MFLKISSTARFLIRQNQPAAGVENGTAAGFLHFNGVSRLRSA
ncbi:hypothetical protein Z948_546 [Sulfitobacter donghicola DSW-25 = KCTC 12864 = JCM 14565]|nr:hypothetical protein Z948_546 [Sulfitobacter donghicola DSW-25 = KCTC 12864 = JCM 14565]